VFRRSIPLVVAAPLVFLAVWSGSLVGPFQFDDWNVIVDQPAVRGFSAWWAAQPGIRPLLKLSYALNWQLSPEAWYFHLFNLLIHGLNVGLVVALLRRWPQLDPASVLWVTAIFALHPVQTEAVTYVCGRSMSLMASCWLAAALCWLKSEEPPAWRWKLLSTGFFLLAMGVRETAWSLPFALLLWQRARGRPWRPVLHELMPLWLALGVAAALASGLERYRRMVEASLASLDPLGSLALQVEALSYLFVEPLLLLRNNIDPDLPAVASFGAGWWLGAALLLGAIGLGLAMLKRIPAAGLALLWPLVLLLPTNGVLVRLDVASERHLYLALLGPAVLAVTAVRSVAPGKGATLSLGALGLVLASATIIRIGDYRSESALWTATAERSPEKARVWNNLGYAHLAEGHPELAIPALRRALELAPDYTRAEVNLERARTLCPDRCTGGAMLRRD
jgi:tetratricopeptide (TPR) repeat protein